MKNISIFWAFILILTVSTVRADALLLQGPNGLYLPHPYVLNKPISVSPDRVAAIRAGEKFNHQKVLRKQKDEEALPPDGATIFIQSCPVAFLKE